MDHRRISFIALRRIWWRPQREGRLPGSVASWFWCGAALRHALWIVLLAAVTLNSFCQRPPLNESPAQGRDDGNSGLYRETFEAAWRIIHETYYDPTFNGLNWEAVRTELLPKAAQAPNEEALRTIIEQMLERLGGSHMAVIPREMARTLESKRPTNASESSGPLQDSTASPRIEIGEGETGIDLRIIDHRPIVTRVDPSGPAGKAGVKPGWILRSIDDQLVSTLLESLKSDRKSLPSQFLAWRLLMSELSGNPGSTVNLGLLNGADRAVTLTIERRRHPGEPVKLGYFPTLHAHLESESVPIAPGSEIGLIRFNLWMVPILRALDVRMDQLRQAEGIILDLRGNLGGLGAMVMGVSGHFLNERVSLGTLKMRDNELKFFANPRRVNTKNERVEPYSGPLAILIDNLTLSAAEIFAGGMQSLGRARIFGEASGGQALPAIWDRLPNGDILYHAFGDFVTATGTRLEGRGVQPDERVSVTREELLLGRDAPLQAALRWIAQQKSR